jgi:hypothetical protein
MFAEMLANVSAGTSGYLAYTMLGLVALFLLSFQAIAYFYWRKSKRMKGATAPV